MNILTGISLSSAMQRKEKKKEKGVFTMPRPIAYPCNKQNMSMIPNNNTNNWIGMSD